MALETSGGLRRAAAGPTVSSNRSSSGDLMKHLSYFATGALKSSLGPISALKHIQRSLEAFPGDFFYYSTHLGQ